VTLARGMNHLDAVHIALGGAFPGLSLEHNHHRRLQSPLTHGRPHLVDEAPCGTRPVSPPTSRPGPDHVGGVDHQHAPYRWEAAADCTAAMIGSQSASAA